MKEYNKEKLHEYAKELFALCLDKGVNFDYNHECKSIYVNYIYVCYLCSELFDLKSNNGIIDDMPIWELIEKVKAL